MTGNEAINYIHSMEWDRSATGYEHAKMLLEKMGNPHKELKYVHIGGTNGKGSTAAMLASILKEAGYCTGLYTSPYLFTFHERMQVNGTSITDSELAELTMEVKGIVEKEDLHPSEFALVCCIAFAYFKRKRCDLIVLEVGMGGERDSTNVIEEAEVTVLTNIGLDHTEFLGDTLEEIARTKSGIIKDRGRVVLYPNTNSVEEVLLNTCEEKKACFRFPDFQKIVQKGQNLEGQIFDYKDRVELFLPLLGEHQLRNASVVLEAVDTLKERQFDISELAIRHGLKKVTWPGRFEVLSKEPVFIVDGGHNVQCIEALAENIKQYLTGKTVVGLTGVLKDKEFDQMFSIVLPYISEFVCITPPSPRCLEGKALADMLCGMGKKAIAYDSIKEAVNEAIKIAGVNGAVVCFGSLYSISEIKSAFARL